MRDGLVICRLILLDRRPPLACIEYGFGKSGSDRPEMARPGKPSRDGGALESSGSTQSDVWIESGCRDTYLCIRLPHQTLRGGNVRPPFEKLRWNTKRNGRRIHIKWFHG